MKTLAFLCLIFLSVLFTQDAYSLDNFWYKDVAINAGGQLLPDSAVAVTVTIQNDNSILYQERFYSVRTDQFGVFLIRVGTGTVLSGNLDDIITYANTRIKIETSTENGWVLSSIINISQIRRFLELDDIDKIGWSLTGNEGTNPADNFLGTTDDMDLVFRINNIEAGRINRSNSNTSFGYNTLHSIDGTAQNNTAIGTEALYSNTTGWSNTAVGKQALYYNTFRGNQVAVGDSALFNNGNNFNQSSPYVDSAKSIRNVAVGSKALFSNEIGFWNTAVGYNAAYYNIMGKSLTAIGTEALLSNIDGKNNTALGTWALYGNTHGSWNTGLGSGALKTNTTGDTNTVIGLSAMYYNNGNGNVAQGMFAAAFNSTGNGNTAIGTKSLFHNQTGSYNTAIGYQAAQSYWWRNYHSSIFIGAFSDGAFNGITNSIAIGNGVLVNGSNQIRLGGATHQTFYCQAIYNGTSTDQPNVVVDNGGRIRRSTSLDRTFDELTVNINSVLGTNSANTLTVNAQINSDLIPDGATRDLGSDINRWGEFYISGSSIHIGASGNEAEINYTANSHLKFTKPVLTPNSIVSLSGNATYSGTAETGLVLYIYNTSGTDYTFESINVPNGQMKVFVYTGSTWMATN